MLFCFWYEIKKKNDYLLQKSGAFSGFTGLKVPNTSTGNDSFKPFSSTPFTFTNSNKKPLASNVQLIPGSFLIYLSFEILNIFLILQHFI